MYSDNVKNLTFNTDMGVSIRRDRMRNGYGANLPLGPQPSRHAFLGLKPLALVFQVEAFGHLGGQLFGLRGRGRHRGGRKQTTRGRLATAQLPMSAR